MDDGPHGDALGADAQIHLQAASAARSGHKVGLQAGAVGPKETDSLQGGLGRDLHEDDLAVLLHGGGEHPLGEERLVGAGSREGAIDGTAQGGGGWSAQGVGFLMDTQVVGQQGEAVAFDFQNCGK